MTKRKISATVDPDRLAQATELVGSDNVSAVLDLALDALVDLERERQWLAAGGGNDLPGEVSPPLDSVPWDD